ncbi:MAG TPA: hypothetical protein EYQ63_06795, partial [Fuerstia sp.]|nr:hypothetical protein [Fuerstiella sp.]
MSRYSYNHIHQAVHGVSAYDGFRDLKVKSTQASALSEFRLRKSSRLLNSKHRFGDDSMKFTPYLLSVLSFLPTVDAAEVEVVVSPRITVVEREGITGGGCPVKVGNRVLSFFPNHPDDFGGSNGTASAISTDGGMSWTNG